MTEDSTRITLSREELYALVWETPMSRLAERFGVSDVGLANICARHRIPRPPRGHWARLEFGKPVRQTPLPRLAAGEAALDTVHVEPVPPPPPGHVPVPRPQRPPIPVPEVLTAPHPWVAATAKSLRSAKANERGLLEPRAQETFDVAVSPASVDRAMRILHALVTALEARGGKVATVPTHGPRETGIEIDGEVVPFSLEEDTLRTEEEPTQAEKQRRERYGLTYYSPTYTYTPTGALTLSLDVHIRDGERRRWSDGKKRRVEGHLPAIVEAVLRFAASLKEQRRAFEEARRRREDLERQRAEKLKLIREEEERLETLLGEVDSWRRSRQIHAYVNAAVEALDRRADPESLDKWAAWARNHADRFNPFVQAEPTILDEKDKWERGH